MGVRRSPNLALGRHARGGRCGSAEAFPPAEQAGAASLAAASPAASSVMRLCAGKPTLLVAGSFT